MTCHQFYGELLELPLVLRTDGALVYKTTPSSFFGLTSGPGREPAAEGAIFELTTYSREEVDDWYQKLKQACVELDGVPREVEGMGVYCFFAFDPNGYKVEIMHYPDLSDL